MDLTRVRLHLIENINLADHGGLEVIADGQSKNTELLGNLTVLDELGKVLHLLVVLPLLGLRKLLEVLLLLVIQSQGWLIVLRLRLLLLRGLADLVTGDVLGHQMFDELVLLRL